MATATCQKEKKRIVILGGGFGGIHAALELEKRLKNCPGTEICLVNRDNFFLFTPMLHEVACSDLELTAIVSPVLGRDAGFDQFKDAVGPSLDLLGLDCEPRSPQRLVGFSTESVDTRNPRSATLRYGRTEGCFAGPERTPPPGRTRQGSKGIGKHSSTTERRRCP